MDELINTKTQTAKSCKKREQVRASALRNNLLRRKNKPKNNNKV